MTANKREFNFLPPPIRQRDQNLVDVVLGDSSTGTVQNARYIPLHRIKPNPQNPRQTRDPEGLQELASSIREHGVLAPLWVRPAGDEFIVIAGDRRRAAAELVDPTMKVPCIIKDVDLDTSYILALLENLQREDIPPVEEAEALFHLEARGFGLAEIARQIHKSVGYVSETIKLYKNPALAQAVKKQTLSKTGAQIIQRVAQSPEEVADLVGRAERGEMKVEDLRRYGRKKAQAPTRGERTNAPDSQGDRGSQARQAPTPAHPAMPEAKTRQASYGQGEALLRTVEQVFTETLTRMIHEKIKVGAPGEQMLTEMSTLITTYKREVLRD